MTFVVSHAQMYTLMDDFTANNSNQFTPPNCSPCYLKHPQFECSVRYEQYTQKKEHFMSTILVENVTALHTSQ